MILSFVFRCINVFSDDLAKIPLYTYESPARFKIDRIMPNTEKQNIAWLLEVYPRGICSTFIFNKSLMQWLIDWGIAFI